MTTKYFLPKEIYMKYKFYSIITLCLVNFNIFALDVGDCPEASSYDDYQKLCNIPSYIRKLYVYKTSKIPAVDIPPDYSCPAYTTRDYSYQSSVVIACTFNNRSLQIVYDTPANNYPLFSEISLKGVSLYATKLHKNSALTCEIEASYIPRYRRNSNNTFQTTNGNLVVAIKPGSIKSVNKGLLRECQALVETNNNQYVPVKWLLGEIDNLLG